MLKCALAYYVGAGLREIYIVMLVPRTAAEKAAWFDGWKAAASGIGRHECLHYATLSEQQAFCLGWDKRNESLEADE